MTTTIRKYVLTLVVMAIGLTGLWLLQTTGQLHPPSHPTTLANKLTKEDFPKTVRLGNELQDRFQWAEAWRVVEPAAPIRPISQHAIAKQSPLNVSLILELDDEKQRYSIIPLHMMSTLTRVNQFFVSERGNLSIVGATDPSQFTQPWNITMPTSSYIMWDTFQSYLSDLDPEMKGVDIDVKKFNQYAYWDTPVEFDSWCKEVFSFGNMSAADMNVLIEYERYRGPNSLKFVYADLYHQFILPHVDNEIAFWDNGARDVSAQFKNKQECIEWCKLQDCLSWRFNETSLACGIAFSVRLGRKPMYTKNAKLQVEQITSGYSLELIKTRRRLQACHNQALPSDYPIADGSANDFNEGWVNRRKLLAG